MSVRKASGNFIRRNAEELLMTREKERMLTTRNLEMWEAYESRARCKFSDGWGRWGKKIEVKGEYPLPKGSAWKECPDDVDWGRKYSVYEKNPRIATKISYGYYGDYCTIIGNTPLPLNKVTSWSIKVLKSQRINGGLIFIGVAPSDIGQNENNRNKCGWYFNCYYSTLCSGPPHNYRRKEYGPRKGDGQYVHTGDSVGVVMDTAKGELSFVVDGVNLGVAFEGIPLGKPLVPCVVLDYEGGSVKLVI